MFDILQDILIVTENGKVIVSKIKNPQIKKLFFGKLVSALSSFCEDLSHGQLNRFEFSNLRFDIIKRENLYFLGSSSKSIKHKKVLKILERIIDLFFDLYAYEDFNDLDGHINLFQELEEYINKTRDEIIIELLFKKKN